MKDKNLNLVLVSTLFPNRVDPVRGVFTAQIAKKLSQVCNLTVVSPLPWFPKIRIFSASKIFQRWSVFSNVPYHDKINGLDVYYPRYFVIPKILIYLHSLFMVPSLYLLLRRLQKEGKVDLVNTHWIFPDGVASMVVSKSLKVPQVLAALGCDLTHFPDLPFRRAQIVWALRGADSIMVVSEEIGKRVAMLGVNEEKIKLAPDGVDFDHFSIKNREVCQKKLDLPSGKKIILQVASLDEVKGTRYLIKAVAILNKKIKDEFQVYIIGDGELRASLIKQSERLGIGRLVHFVGKVAHDEIQNWMNASNVFCLTSIREGRPNVLLEAFACGVPVVATAVGGVPEIVNPSNGYLAESRNPDDVASHLLKALNNQWDRQSIVDSVSNLTWTNAAMVYFKEFSSLKKR